ncbi:MAG: Dabb family protein [Dehalococcoidia bacterium]|nr:Dabb family protein [Dehalococcoidia bacterium]MYA52147.1 Dabb family protein [Dehalococcoidia bacterium]
MIRHIVTITLREDATAEDIESFFEELVPISEHPKAIEYYCGWNFQDLGDPCDIGISCAFASQADFEEYMASPDHGPPGVYLRRISDRWSVIDYVEGSPLEGRAATRAERGPA